MRCKRCGDSDTVISRDLNQFRIPYFYPQCAANLLQQTRHSAKTLRATLGSLRRGYKYRHAECCPYDNTGVAQFCNVPSLSLSARRIRVRLRVIACFFLQIAGLGESPGLEKKNAGSSTEKNAHGC
mmetsp:Transcript_43921/g.70277  ORF Transcript_43921/g.70277 Transcript_43921/m.70277 type:complete len:126 (-) Transcript_43921:881-1258(-)